MTIQPTLPGCFGSAILYRIDAPECTTCTQARECADRVRDRGERVRSQVGRLDVKFGTERLPEVERWFKSRWKRPVTRADKRTGALETVAQWKSQSVNAYELKHRMNPASKERTPILYEAFEFILSAGPFKPRDLIEELRENDPDRTKVFITRMSKDICETLLEIGILKQEARGVLCLTN